MMLFERDWVVTVGTLRVAKPLRVAFEIATTLKAVPNRATVKLWNLTRDHRAQIEQAANAQVVVDAGFIDDGGAETIFSGELRRAHGHHRGAAAQKGGTRSEQTGGDVITHVEARDGGRAYSQARISMAFGEGVSVATVLRAAAKAMGVGVGNLDEVSAVAKLLTGADTYPDGTVISGIVSRELTRIAAGLGLRWSVQHGNLQFLKGGAALQTEAVRLSSRTGLVGAPEVGTRGHVKVVSLLTRDLWVGRRVILDSTHVQGRFTAHAVKYRGDSHANDWFSESELVPEAA